MKKKLLLVVAFMCCVLFFTGVAFAGYQVSGAGTGEANGLYCETGEYNGLPIYQKAGTTWEIFYEIVNNIGHWWIDDAREVMGNSTYHRQIILAPTTPPLDGWSRESAEGADLPPTLSEQSCGAIPTLNEWGMIIFSLVLAGSAFWFIRKESHKNC